MIRLFRRSPLKRAGHKNRVVLRLEALDGRATPSGDLVPPAAPAPPTSQDGPQVANQAPRIVNLGVEAIGNGWYLISGQVLDERPAGLPVQFGGLASMNGVVVTTDEYGEFSYVVKLRTDGTDTGYLSAQTVDDLGAVSDVVYARVDP